MVELLSVTLVHDQDPVGVDDCGQSVSNDQHRAILETLLQGLLDEVVGLQVHIGSGLIEHKDLCLSDDSSGETKKLLLTETEHVVALRDHGHESTLAVLGDVVPERDFLQNLFDIRILELLEGIQILAD